MIFEQAIIHGWFLTWALFIVLAAGAIIAVMAFAHLLRERRRAEQDDIEILLDGDRVRLKRSQRRGPRDGPT